MTDDLSTEEEDPALSKVFSRIEAGSGSRGNRRWDGKPGAFSFSRSDDDLILSDYIMGTKSAKEIAAKLEHRFPAHYIHARALKIRRNLGISTTRRPKRIDWEIVNALLQEHTPVQEIAEFYDVSEKTIKRGPRRKRDDGSAESGEACSRKPLYIL